MVSETFAFQLLNALLGSFPHGIFAVYIVMSRGHDWSADHWSFGVLIYDMAMGKLNLEGGSAGSLLDD